MSKQTSLSMSLVCVLLAGCRTATQTKPEEATVAASVFMVSAVATDSSVMMTGTVKPRLEVDLAAQIAAPVAEVTKLEGERVRRGELLVRLRAPALQANVAQAVSALAGAQHQQAAAQSQANLAHETFSRYQQLRDRHSVTPHELDQMAAQNAAAEAQQKSAGAQVAAAESMLAAQRAHAADAVLYAPFEGVVSRRLVDPGAMATPGMALLHLQSSGDEEVEFTVPGDLLGSLQTGMKIEVFAEGDKVRNANILSMAPQGDAMAHTFLVKASLPKDRPLNTGTVVQVRVPAHRQAHMVTVPVSALMQQGGLDGVLAINSEGRAEIRYIAIGYREEDRIEILSGLGPGDRVLLHGDPGLAGKRIEVRP